MIANTSKKMGLSVVDKIIQVHKQGITELCGSRSPGLVSRRGAGVQFVSVFSNGRCPHHTRASDGRTTSSGVSSAGKLGKRAQMGWAETRQVGTE